MYATTDSKFTLDLFNHSLFNQLKVRHIKVGSFHKFGDCKPVPLFIEYCMGQALYFFYLFFKRMLIRALGSYSTRVIYHVGIPLLVSDSRHVLCYFISNGKRSWDRCQE